MQLPVCYFSVIGKYVSTGYRGYSIFFQKIHHGVIPSMPTPPDGPNKFDVEICFTSDTIQYALNKLMRTGVSWPYTFFFSIQSNPSISIIGLKRVSRSVFLTDRGFGIRGEPRKKNAHAMLWAHLNCFFNFNYFPCHMNWWRSCTSYISQDRLGCHLIVTKVR